MNRAGTCDELVNYKDKTDECKEIRKELVSCSPDGQAEGVRCYLHLLQCPS